MCTSNFQPLEIACAGNLLILWVEEPKSSHCCVRTEISRFATILREDECIKDTDGQSKLNLDWKANWKRKTSKGASLLSQGRSGQCWNSQCQIIYIYRCYIPVNLANGSKIHRARSWQRCARLIQPLSVRPMIVCKIGVRLAGIVRDHGWLSC